MRSRRTRASPRSTWGAPRYDPGTSGGASMHRRTIVALAVLPILALTAGALAQGPREPIKIGVLNAVTGPLAVNGSEINEGIKLYWEDEMNLQVAGRQVRLVIEDEEGKP